MSDHSHVGLLCYVAQISQRNSSLLQQLLHLLGSGHNLRQVFQFLHQQHHHLFEPLTGFVVANDLALCDVSSVGDGVSATN